MSNKLQNGLRILNSLLKARTSDPKKFNGLVKTIPNLLSGGVFAGKYTEKAQGEGILPPLPINPFLEYFQKEKKGNGTRKWEHYFDIYHRHFARFIGTDVNILEIGIDSGGSLEMWRSYFGEKSHIYGIDIEEACKVYENEYTSVFIGDQADRSFWSDFRKKTAGIDILVDDGGHNLEQQQITLEEMLPYLRPGGVYFCEDIHGDFNKFSAFAIGLVNELNHQNFLSDSVLQSTVTPFQSSVHSIHFYPYALVIEKHPLQLEKLTTIRHGTEWQHF